jgi:hypothetical protein
LRSRADELTVSISPNPVHKLNCVFGKHETIRITAERSENPLAKLRLWRQARLQGDNH